MKRFLLIFITALIFFHYKSSGQTALLKKTWIGQQLQYLKIADSTALLEHEMIFDECHYKLSGKKLTLTVYYWTTSDTLRHEDNYPFEISKLTKDTLIIKPLSETSKQEINDKDFLLLIDSSEINDTKFNFEKLLFSATACYGSCPRMKLEIDSSGKIFFLGDAYTGKYRGLYEGQLKPPDLLRLKNILQHSWLDNFPDTLGHGMVDDAPIYNFIFYYNGKKKVSRGYDVPYFNYDLLAFLLDSYKRANLKKDNQTHNFENLSWVVQ
ncbi:MAG TPA: DUF6438 domain-containing protein [Bacteroidia bacterium]|nr:DUF6438 domain-containing protein [Bacteroidia bacterium]